jgi:DNA replication protein DnaC
MNEIIDIRKGSDWNPKPSAMTTKTCKSCETLFEADAPVTLHLFGKSVTLAQNYCDPCQRELENRAEQLSRGERPGDSRAPWETICDKAYQGFDRSMLPESSLRACDAILRWEHSKRGCGLSGESRKGKTYIMTELMRRQYAKGYSVWMPTAGTFAYQSGSTFGNERREMMDKCLNSDLLFIDDIGNARFTDRVEKDLFHVLEQRRRNLRPVFVTINGKGSDLKAILSEQSAAPIVNRLRDEVCEFYRID